MSRNVFRDTDGTSGGGIIAEVVVSCGWIEHGGEEEPVATAQELVCAIEGDLTTAMGLL